MGEAPIRSGKRDTNEASGHLPGYGYWIEVTGTQF